MLIIVLHVMSGEKSNAQIRTAIHVESDLKNQAKQRKMMSNLQGNLELLQDLLTIRLKLQEQMNKQNESEEKAQSDVLQELFNFYQPSEEIKQAIQLLLNFDPDYMSNPCRKDLIKAKRLIEDLYED